MYFDSHAHLDDAHFDGDRAAILDDLKNHGVTMVMNVGCDLPSSERSVPPSAATRTTPIM